MGSAKQASDFIIVNEYLINYVRKNYEHGGDIGTALENMDHYNFAALLPTLQMSAITGDEPAQVADRTRENRQFELQYNVEYKAYSHRVDIYDQNKSKAYSFLWGQCSKAMQHKVESRPQFVSTIKNDPVELIKAIKEYAMAYQDTKYPVLTILEAMQAYITIRQQDGESLVDYLKRYRVSRDVFFTHMGSELIIPKLAVNLSNDDTVNPSTAIMTYSDYGINVIDEADDEIEQEYIHEANERFVALHYLKSLDTSKYGSLINGLTAQYSLKSDHYPKTLEAAHAAATTH